MNITIEITGDIEARKMLSDIGDQAPFAMSKALNALANRAQSGIRDSLNGKFTLRRESFIKQSIYRNRQTDFATKANLEATVRVNPARDVLSKFEDGGDKRAQSGGNLAVPLPDVKRLASGIIPARLRPKAFFGNKSIAKITTPNGTFLVQTQKGSKKMGLGVRSVFLYKLVPNVRIAPRLLFVATANEVVDKYWREELEAAVEYAIDTAR